jgi:hypothetical protein
MPLDFEDCRIDSTAGGNSTMAISISIPSSSPETFLSCLGALGASSVGPRNIKIDRQNPDLLASPDTDYGSIPNLKFSFSLAHNRLLEGGWAREVTIVNFLPPHRWPG